MNEIAVREFDEVDALLQRVGSIAGAAETHGFLCGIICAAGHADSQTWYPHLIGQGDQQDGPVRVECLDLLDKLYRDTLLQMNHSELDFHPLLPGDEVPLELRSKAMGDWCQGYLFGLGLGGFNTGDGGLPGEVGEFLRDIGEISGVNFDFDESDDMDEAAYQEIMEYIRMGVLLILEELQPVTTLRNLQ